MDGLDLLKQHWNNDKGYPKVNSEEIQRMLYKSSSSLVKWIFIISLIELGIGLCLNGWFLFFSGIDRGENLEPAWYQFVDHAVTVLSYVVTLYFIYSFFKSYIKIKNTNNTKDLLKDILASREKVNYYISFNIYLAVFSLLWGTLSVVLEKHIYEKGIGEMILFGILMALIVFVMGWIIIKVMKFYFKLVYLRLVQKLEKNYDELVLLDLDQEE